MSRLARLTLSIIALTSLTASTAAAVTWHDSGDTAFTATTGATTLSATGGAGMVCPAGANVTGTIAATPFVGTTWPAASGTAKGSNCNPVNPTTGRATLVTGGNVTVTNGTGSCPLGSNDRAHLSDNTFTITTASGGSTSPHLGPVVSRTS